MGMIGIGFIFVFDGSGIFWLLTLATSFFVSCSIKDGLKLQPYLQKQAKKKKNAMIIGQLIQQSI